MGPPSRDRVLGALLGVHAGDSLGAGYEFTSWLELHSYPPEEFHQIKGGGVFNWAVGQPTDDTDLTRAVLLAYRDKYRADEDTEFDFYTSVGKHMVNWYTGTDWPHRKPGKRPVDVGGATAAALRSLTQLRGVVSSDKPTGAGPGRQGNGSLMRCIPTGLFENYQDVKTLSERAANVSAITHDDEVCTIACAAYCAIVSKLIRGVEDRDAVEYGVLEAKALSYESRAGEAVVKAIRKGWTLNLADMAYRGPQDGELEFGGRGHVLDSLRLAIAALRDERDLKDILVDVVRIGYDTDTNGAVAGGLLGAKHGVDAIPKEWRDVLWYAPEFEKTMDEILEAQAEIVTRKNWESRWL